MPCVILEGPDGAGKTELSKALLEGPCKGWEFIHNGTYPELNGRGLFKLYADQILASGHKGILIDRSFDSELIYGPVMRKQDRLGTLGRGLLNRLCSAQGVLQIVCLPPKEVARENWRAKVADYVDHASRWSAIYDQFDRLTEDRRYVIYDYTVNLERTKKDVNRRFNFLISAKHNFALPEFPEVVGSPTATHLIIGEQIGGLKSDDYIADLPFFDLRGVSKFFWEQLRYVKADEDNLLFVNSLDFKGKPNDLGLIWRSVPTLRRAIALGEAAYRQAQKYDINNLLRIHHPNYTMRFNDIAKFRRDLRKVLR